MSFSQREQRGCLLFLCLSALSASGTAAENLPSLRVDPALLGLPAEDAKPAPRATTTIKPAKTEAEPRAVPAPTPATETEKPLVLAPPAQPLPMDAPEQIAPAPETAPSLAPKAVAPRPQAKPAPRSAAPTPAAVQVPAAPAPAPIPAPLPAVPVAVTAPVVSREVERQAPAPAAPKPAVTFVPTMGIATNMAPLRVDPALLGAGVSARSAAPAVVAVESSTARSAGAASLTRPDSPAAVSGPSAARRESLDPANDTAPAYAYGPYVPPVVEDRPKVAPLYSAHVEAGLLPQPKLKASSRILPISRDGAVRPSFLVADRITGRNDVEMTAEGDVELRRVGSVVGSDRLTYWHLEDEVEAIGNVRLERDQDQMTGPKMRLRMEDSVGYFEEPKYRITRSPLGGGGEEQNAVESPVAVSQRQPLTAHGAASRLEFEGENQYRLTNATYSTCGPGEGAPDWYAEVADLKLDYDRERGDASDAKVVFKGVPILYSPWLSFSLNNQRKSGLLSPSFGSTSKSGVEYTQPFYWNIAPNMDATISPRLMAKRGTQWNTEFRYLDYNYTGQMRFEYLPDDRIENKRRSGYSIFHTQNFGYGFTGSLNLNGVSDDTYLTDMSTRLAVTSQTNLLREGRLNYGGSWWSASLMAQRYQTLQDPALPPVVKPYDRLPQFTVTANRPDLPGGLNFAFNGEYVNFSHASLVEGRRTTLYPQLSLPLEWASVQMTPKLGLHSTRYALDRQAAGTPSGMSRSVPIFSFDSSVTFERDFDWFGRGLAQTLEPRVYYLYVPKKDQNLIPVFDTALADFNFAQIFSENRYGGGDRIADANQVTAAVTSRIIDPNTGSELVRGALGQRYYFTTQHVTLPGEIARATRKADILAAVSGQVMPRTWVDTGWQYNPNLHRTERFNLGGRWQPEIGKVLNAGYRYNRNLAAGQPDVKQVDFSGQWPLGGGWYGVGRYNYSLQEKRLIESVGGLELEGNCWVARFVVQRIATATQKTNTAFFVQLELNGFSRLGSNPLDLLKRNIPGYGRINQPTADPVFAAD